MERRRAHPLEQAGQLEKNLELVRKNILLDHSYYADPEVLKRKAEQNLDSMTLSSKQRKLAQNKLSRLRKKVPTLKVH